MQIRIAIENLIKSALHENDALFCIHPQLKGITTFE